MGTRGNGRAVSVVSPTLRHRGNGVAMAVLGDSEIHLQQINGDTIFENVESLM